MSTIFKYQLELLLILKFPNFKAKKNPTKKTTTKGLVYPNDNFQQKQIHLSESINVVIGQLTKYLIIYYQYNIIDELNKHIYIRIKNRIVPHSLK